MEDIPESKNTWTIAEEEQVFKLHTLYGNKWSAIATRIPGRTENSIKNKFYSTLRRGLRKINKYISKVRRKTHKEDLSNNKIIPPDFLTKLSAIADGNYSSRYEAKPKAVEASQDIKQRLINLAQQSYEYGSNSIETFQLEQDLLRSILQFKKHCKKRKGKSKARLESNLTHNENLQIQSSSGQCQHSSQGNPGVSKNQAEGPDVGDQLRNERTQVKIQQQPGGQHLVAFSGHQERFDSVRFGQGLKHSCKIDASIKTSSIQQQNLQNMFVHYPMAPSTLMTGNYSFIQMVGPPQSYNSYPSFSQGYFPTPTSLDLSRKSLQWDMMSSQTIDNRFYFLQQVPMMLPKQQSISLAESAIIDMRQDLALRNRKQSERCLGVSEAYKTSYEDNNNNSRLVRSDLIKRRPLIKQQQSNQCKKQEEDKIGTLYKQ